MNGFELESLGRIGLAVLLGGLIGLERQAHGRPAGLRTHILVCAGSALIMTLTQAFGDGIDPGRAVAGIVTGIGFLGGGVIVKSRDIVRGLTTAACVWFVAALGIGIGQGLYVLSAGATGIGLAVLIMLARLAHRVPSVVYDTVVVSGPFDALETIEQSARGELTAAGFRVVNAAIGASRSANQVEITFSLRSRTRTRTPTVETIRRRSPCPKSMLRHGCSAHQAGPQLEFSGHWHYPITEISTPLDHWGEGALHSEDRSVTCIAGRSRALRRTVQWNGF